MKNAKFIKNEFYKTLYRASDDTYQYAVISFTTVRYEDKDRAEFVSFNKIDDAKSDEVWKEKLSKRIANYEDFINNIESWKQEGTYKELRDKVKYMEPESISEKEFALDNIEQVEITQVLDKGVNLAFVEIYDQNGSKYDMTCDFDNKDVILSELIVNYDKLCRKGKVNILNKEENNTDHSKIKVTSVTFIVNNNQVDTYFIYEDEYGRPYLKKTTLEKGLNRVDNDKNIQANYKAIIDGKSTDITRSEFDAFVSVITDYNKNNKNHVNDDEIITDANINNNHTNYYGYEREVKKNKKIALFVAAVALAGTGLCYLLSRDNKPSIKTPIKKSTSTSQTGNSNATVTTITTTDSNSITTNNGYVITSSSTDNSNSNTNTITNSNTNTIASTSTNVNTNTNTNVNSTTTNNGYVATTRPTTAYTGTYRTINTSDMVTSGTNRTTTKTTTKTTTQNVVPSGTVNRSDMVTAGPNPGEQIFTKDGATTTTKKATTTTKSTTSYNPYADLIITHEINNGGKSLVLKK